jgi:drug/metabolite transporter (DMT)-like permease
MKKEGILYVILSALLYGIAPIFVKNIYVSGVGVLLTVFFRFLVVCVCLFPSVWFSKLGKEFGQVSKQQIQQYALLGIMYLGVIGFYLGSLKFLPVALAVLLMYTYPLLVFLYNRLVLGIKFGNISLICLFGAIVGMWLLLGVEMSNISLMGIMLALGASLSFAGYVILSKSQMSTSNTMVLALYANLFSLGVILSIWVGFSDRVINFSLNTVGYMLALGVVSTVLPYLLFLRGLKLLGSGQSSVLAMLEPLFSIVFGILFLAESISWIQAVGGFILFGGSMVLAFLPEKKSEFHKNSG